MTNSLWYSEEDARGISRRSVLLGGTAAAAIVGLGLTGCSGGAKQASGNRLAISDGPKQGGTPRMGGDLIVAAPTGGSAETIDVMAGVQTPDIIRIYSLYDLLFIQAPGGKVLPGLCTVATPNADASEWTFELRKGVTWHDGKAFDADDVVYTIKKSWGSDKNAFFSVMSTLVDFTGVRKVDSHTVKVPLKQRIAKFPSVTCIQQCVVVQDGTTDFGKGIGTGPYKLQSFTPGKRSVFVANKNYWDGAPYIDRLIIDSSYASDQPRLNALLAGQADIVPGVSPVLAAANASNSKLVLGNQPGPGFVGFPMRVDQGGALGDAKVRQALKLMPDRKQYIEAAFQGYAVVSNDCVGYTDEYFASDLKRDQDLGQAKSLLKAAGYADLSLDLSASAAAPGMLESATLFKQHAAQAGVKVNVKQSSTSDYFTPAGGYLTRPFSMINYTTGVNSLPAFYVNSMLAGAPFSDTHWGDKGAPAFGTNNALLFDALSEIDETKAKDKWHAIQVQMFNEGPYILPAVANWLDAYSSRVRGVKTSPALNCDNYNFSKAWIAQ